MTFHPAHNVDKKIHEYWRKLLSIISIPVKQRGPKTGGPCEEKEDPVRAAYSRFSGGRGLCVCICAFE